MGWKIDNQDLINALFTNDMNNKELSQCLRQVYRAVELIDTSDKGLDAKNEIMAYLLLAADKLETYL